MNPFGVGFGIAFVVAIAGAGGVGWHYGGKNVQADWDAEKVEVAEAERKLQQQVDEARQKADDWQQNAMGAYELYQSKAKTVYVKVQERVQADVGAYPVFSDRACDWPPPVVQLVNSAFSNLRSPADTAVAPATLPAPPAAAGRPAGSGLPVAPQPAGAVEPVRADARAAGGSGPLSAAGSGKPPKPVPRKVAP